MCKEKLDFEFFSKEKAEKYQKKGEEQINQILEYKGSPVEGLVFLIKFLRPIAEALLKCKMSISLTQVFDSKRESSYNMNHPIFLLIHFLNDLLLYIEKELKESIVQQSSLEDQIQQAVKEKQKIKEPRTQKMTNEEYEELINFKF